MRNSLDYGWKSDARAPSHSYLEPVVLRLIAKACSNTSGRQAPAKVFDAGCGNGVLLGSLKGAGYTVAGCDSSEAGIAIAHQALGNDVRLECLSVYDDLAASFGCDWDFVVATEVIEHLYAPREFLGRARALLRLGGTLILSTPYHGYLKNLVMAVTGTLDAHFTALWDGGHIKFWSYHTLTKVLQEERFEGFHFTGAGRFSWLWKSMIVSSQRAK